METGIKLIIGTFLSAGLGLCATSDFTAVLIARHGLGHLDTASRVGPMPVLPALDVTRAGSFRALFGPKDETPVVAVTGSARSNRDTPPASSDPLADRPKEKSQPESSRIGACLFGGVAGTGAALVMGPGEIGALLASAALIAPTAPLIAVVLGGAFIAGCAGTAVLVPLLQLPQNAQAPR